MSAPKPWCEVGHEVACTQLKLPSPAHVACYRGYPQSPVKILPPPIRVLNEGDGMLQVQCSGGFHLAFYLCGPQAGSVASMGIGKRQILHDGPVPCFWRAPTDNDRGGEGLSYCARWRNSGIDQLSMVSFAKCVVCCSFWTVFQVLPYDKFVVVAFTLRSGRRSPVIVIIWTRSRRVVTSISHVSLGSLGAEQAQR